MPSAPTTFSTLARGEMWAFFKFPYPMRRSFSLFVPIVCVLPSTNWFTSVSVLLPMLGIANGS